MKIVTLGIISGELTRYATFTMDAVRLVYANAKAELGIDVLPLWERGADIVANRNAIVPRMAGEGIVWLDDDHSFEPELASTLLAKAEAHGLDILAAAVARRYPPFLPVISVPDPSAEYGIRNVTPQEMPAPQDLVDGVWHLPLGATVGGAGVFVHRRVYEAIGSPWYEGYKLDPGHLMEDVYLAVKAGEKGFRVGVDLTTRLWHTHVYRSRMVYNRDGGWGIEVDLQGLDPTNPWIQLFEYEPPTPA